MCIRDSPSRPSRFSAGTGTSSKTSSAVGEERMPALSLICWPREKPGVPFSTTKVDTCPSTLA